jgi:YHS domain-containing protein
MDIRGSDTMKLTTIVFSALMILVIAVSSKTARTAESAKAPPTTAPAATQPSDSQKPINKFCAVNRDEEIDPTVTYVYKGKVIGFCCDDCIPKFKKDPEKYMKDLK